MKIVLYLLLFSVFLQAKAQDLERVDASIQLYPSNFEDPGELSAMIKRDFMEPEEQVRAVYTWIIHNVAYDPGEYKKFDYRFKDYRERNKKEEKTRGQIIRRTVQTGKAVCEGYAMLFEKLCNDLEIPNYLVRGDIKTQFDDIGRPFKNIHMWNIALLEGKPYLFDPTWGAGKYRGRFISEPSYNYYKASPQRFILTHFPVMSEDALLEESISREVFSSWPLLIDKSMTLDKILSPRNGLLDSGEEAGRFRFKLIVPAQTMITYALDGVRQVADTVDSGEFLEFDVPFSLGDRQLLIYFDDRPALAYRIK